MLQSALSRRLAWKEVIWSDAVPAWAGGSLWVFLFNATWILKAKNVTCKPQPTIFLHSLQAEEARRQRAGGGEDSLRLLL